MLVLALMSGAAVADGAHRFIFTAYIDAAGGADVMAGRYRAALKVLGSYPGATGQNSSETDTNRCVAYSMTLQWQDARAACDAAVQSARRERNISPERWTLAPASDDDYLALAYANRAVMYWLSQDDARAHEDLAHAQELSPRADFVAWNVAALRGDRAVALAAAPKN